MINTRRFYIKKKTFSTFIVYALCLFLIVGILNIINISLTKVNHSLYDYLPSNVLEEEISLDGYDEETIQNELEKKANHYSLNGNKVKAFYASAAKRLEDVLLTYSDGTSEILNITLYISDCTKYLINFTGGVKCEVVKGENTENEMIAITNKMINKHNISLEETTLRYKDISFQINSTINLNPPDKKSYNNMYEDNIYIDFNTYKSLFNSVVEHESLIFFAYYFEYEKDLTPKQWEEIFNSNEQTTLYAYQQKIAESNAILNPIKLIVNVYIFIIILIYLISICLVIITKNNENKDVYFISNIFYMQRKKYIKQTIFRDFLLLSGIFIVSVALLYIISLILSLSLNQSIILSPYIYLLYVISLIIIYVVDIISYLINMKNIQHVSKI